MINALYFIRNVLAFVGLGFMIVSGLRYLTKIYLYLASSHRRLWRDESRKGPPDPRPTPAPRQ